MYKCDFCGKSYKSRTTLTRHIHNHTDDPHHECNSCGVAFARRDILNRHLRQGHVDESVASRQRTHTACDGCKAARVKCDGREPCQCCSTAQQTCVYSTSSRRISKAVQRRSHRPPASPEASTNPSAALLSPPLAETDVDFDLEMDMEGSLSFDPEIPGCQSFVQDSTMPSAAVENGYRQPGLDLPVDLDGISWPWLHETIFLQDDPFAGLFEEMPEPQVDIHGIDTCLPDQLGDAAPPKIAERPVVSKTSLTDEVDELVEYATRTASEAVTLVARQTYWRMASGRLGPAFALHERNNGSVNEEEHIIRQAITVHYMPKFNRLWPMFSRYHFDPDTLNPVLYLVLVSIGSMYGSDYQQHFGTLLHERLRRLLAASLFDLEGPEGDMTWLTLARLLTQVQGLYFGHKKGFSYAQHLGALLIAQSRRLNLFQKPDSTRSHPTMDDALLAQDALDLWRQSETRKRLAFGIMRADVFTSVLLNSRPLLSHEEVNLTLPKSERLWHNDDNLSPREQLLTSRIEDGCSTQIMFSDLLRIMFERNERAPLSEATSYELCLFGMQSALWRFSHDADLFPRLTGTTWSAQAPSSQSNVPDKEVSADYADPLQPSPSTTGIVLDDLGQVHRSMRDLTNDRDRVEQALDSWYESFQSARRSSDFTKHRDSLMSSLLLWNISHLKLHAPLAQLHEISYRAGEKRTTTDGVVKQIREWAKSRSASMAAGKALAICDLISQELSRPVEMRACFNFLAFGSLHHAVVVLWTVSELGGTNDGSGMGQARTSSKFASLLKQRETCGLLLECAMLFKDLSSLGGASFGTAAERLSNSRFPSGAMGNGNSQ